MSLKENILKVAERAINFGATVMMLIILIGIFLYGVVICIEPNKFLLYGEMVAMVIGVIFAIKRMVWGK